MADRGLAWTRCRGRSGWNSPLGLPDGLAAEAQNITFATGDLGSKRAGCTSVGTLTGFTGPCQALVSYLPGQDETARELFVVDSAATVQIGRMAAGSTLTALTLADDVASHGARVNGVALNGKLYLAFDSDENRLHVFDPGGSTSTVRRAGMGTPAAATVADHGTGTYAATARSYRIAFTEQRSSVTRRRSLLGASVSFTPSGSGSAARVTKPASLSESETHWELYGSTDDVTYYGPLATTAVGTTTVDDSSDPTTWATDFDAAPEEGANTPFPSVQFLATDGLRLYGLGVWESAGGDSLTPVPGRLYVTPALGESGLDDDERVSNVVAGEQGWIDLGRNAGGVDRGLACFQNLVIAFQSKGIFKFVPTGNVDVPLRRVSLDSELGGVSHASIVIGIDEFGQPALYFLDPALGPYRYGAGGLQWCGKDVRDLWATVNLGATVVAHGLYHKAKRQVWWWIATGTATAPDRMIVFDCTKGRYGVDADGDVGVRGGWATWTGDLAACGCSAVMASTLGASMSAALSPYSAPTSGLALFKADSGTTDAGTAFQAYLESPAFDLEPLPQDKSLVRTYVLGQVAQDVVLQQTLIRNFGDETGRTSTVNLTAQGNESRTLRRFEDAALTGAFTVQVRLGDAEATDSTFTLDRWYAPELTRQGWR